MLWIEYFGDLAAETGLPLHVGQQFGLQANDDWGKIKKKFVIINVKLVLQTKHCLTIKVTSF